MYKCSKCQREYDEETEECPSCGSPVISEEMMEEDEIWEYDKEVLLITVMNEIQASMMEELLKDHNIPVLKKRKEAGSYLNIYMGMNFYGADLYVPSKLYESAKELIEQMEPEKEALEQDEELEREKKAYQEKRSIKTWIILLFFVPGILMIAAVIIAQLISLFVQ